VNRRARRAKTDRLDGDKLLAMLQRYAAGERRGWSVVRVPTRKHENARQAHRELGRLGQERTAHIDRIRALLVLQNVRVKYVGGRLWQRWWTCHAREPLLCVRAEVERESKRLSLGADPHDRGRATPGSGPTASEPQVAGLAQLRGIGVGSGSVLVKEPFGWRRVHNRREDLDRALVVVATVTPHH
jgi:transposase